ncbi:hypothetical protein [Cellulomonas sp.]|uniref:hypothetical protein n=1 Tax=Cellulomonas sp. TaxID=40001 RepID=UPI001B0D629B|nr:hypothetical protein [Cellulomonas sp.]MBO9554927.1 hypothetical protein [Cellulomonas sp.]
MEQFLDEVRHHGTDWRAFAGTVKWPEASARLRVGQGARPGRGMLVVGYNPENGDWFRGDADGWDPDVTPPVRGPGATVPHVDAPGIGGHPDVPSSSGLTHRGRLIDPDVIPAELQPFVDNGTVIDDHGAPARGRRRDHVQPQPQVEERSTCGRVEHARTPA